MFNEELPAIVSLGVLAAAFLAAFLHDMRRQSRDSRPSPPDDSPGPGLTSLPGYFVTK